MINPRVFSQRESQVENEFVPTFAVSLAFTGHFLKPTKIIKPVQIDDAAVRKMEEGLIAYYDQDYSKSLALYLELVNDYPHFPLAHSRLGDLYYKLEMPNKALAHWNKTLFYEPKNYKVKRAIQQLEEELAAQ